MHCGWRFERLCRYVARPPIATERLSELADGRILYRLRHRWRDGTTHVVFEPLDLVARLAALVPAPYRCGREGSPGRSCCAACSPSDAFRCDRCGGRMRILAAIGQPEVIRAILDCLGLNSRAPPLTPAPSPEPTDLELGFEEHWPID